MYYVVYEHNGERKISHCFATLELARKYVESIKEAGTYTILRGVLRLCRN